MRDSYERDAHDMNQSEGCREYAGAFRIAGAGASGSRNSQLAGPTDLRVARLDAFLDRRPRVVRAPRNSRHHLASHRLCLQHCGASVIKSVAAGPI
jgi:hypothetical protein